MAEWLIEEGIAEHRAVRLEGGRIAQARVAWPNRLMAGSVIEARLVARAAGSTRGTARADSDEEILVDGLPREASEGAPLRIAITRAALEGPGRLKRAQGRPTAQAPRTRSLAGTLKAAGHAVAPVRRFPAGDWDTLHAEALTGEIAFGGGTLLIAPTPAMTTVDIDGGLAPRALAIAAVPALGDALRRLDIGGTVAVDFPTLAAKAHRREVDLALDGMLADWPHDRTAMNGFGLVQIVSRSERPSLVQLAAWQRTAFIWRNLLRRAADLDGPGVIELAMHPALEGAVEASHLAELERRSGKRVRIVKAATLVLEAPHAQLLRDE